MTGGQASKDERSSDTLILGAGLAGLSCANTLRDNGVDVRVLEKSRGVGGRCATRRIEGTRVDHGLAFYHGDDPDFLEVLGSVESDSPFTWPRRVFGDGTPCQPRAFRAREQRLAFAGGVSTFPKHLARGLPVDLETRATRIDVDGDILVVATESGQRYRAHSVVLALPAGQIPSLLPKVDPSVSRDLAAAVELLAGVSMVRCLALIAGYPHGIPLPDWDVCYPSESDILQMASQDSTKRPAPAQPVFVFQGRPRWSAARWNEPSTVWTEALLSEAKPYCGEWVTKPAWVDTQPWRYARLAGGDSLTAPLLIRLADGCCIGITGEAMADGGGVQAAWLAGRQMALRLLGDRSR